MKRLLIGLAAVGVIFGATACDDTSTGGGDTYPHGVVFFPVTTGGAGGGTTMFPIFY